VSFANFPLAPPARVWAPEVGRPSGLLYLSLVRAALLATPPSHHRCYTTRTHHRHPFTFQLNDPPTCQPTADNRSVKKKVSRRSNLQAAFANSDHDISLLEGNKFKLILRVSLDQVDIRCDNNEHAQLWQQQQQFHEQQLLALAKQKKFIQDKKRELESDLLVLKQMELLSGQLVTADKTTLNLNLSQSMERILKKLNSLEQQQQQQQEQQHQLQQQQQPNADHESAAPDAAQNLTLQQTAQDSYLIQASVGSPSQQSNLNDSLSHQNLIAKEQQQQKLSAVSAGDQQDQQQQSSSSTKQTDASLEFIINNEVTTKDYSSKNSNLNTSSRTLNESTEQSASGSGHNLHHASTTPDGQQSQPHAGANCESLVVSFPSRDRRQAFIQAFLDAKQQRIKEQQKRMFSSSMALKFGSQHQPTAAATGADPPLMKSRSIATDLRRNKLQHQDEVLEMRYNSSLGDRMDAHDGDRISSAPCAGTIGRCASCSTNYTESVDKAAAAAATSRHHHHHHHHQLMHQPASHPALLHTICCNEQHNDGGLKKSQHSFKSLNDQAEHLTELPEKLSAMDGDGYAGCHVDISAGGGQSDTGGGCHKQAGSGTHESSLVSSFEGAGTNWFSHHQILMLKFVPRFLAALPMTSFLSVQHPALQLSCSVVRRQPTGSLNYDKSVFEGFDEGLSKKRSQTVRDNKGQLWLCLSNGYVSHVSLIEFIKRDCSGADENHSTGNRQQCYDIVPVVKCRGDICKSHINCAAQIFWPAASKRTAAAVSTGEQQPETRSAPDDHASGRQQASESLADSGQLERAAGTPEPPDVSVKSASPPIDIGRHQSSVGAQSVVAAAARERRISSSAPAPSKLDSEQIMMSVSGQSRYGSSTALVSPAASGNRPADGSNKKEDARGATPDEAAKRGPSRRLINARYSSHYHPHGHDQSRCRNYRCAAAAAAPTTVACNQIGGYRGRYRTSSAAVGAPTVSGQSRLLSQPATNQHQHHHHHYHHHHHHHHHHHQAYNNRHHTVSLAELRRALERQSKSSFEDQSPLASAAHRRHLAPPANTPDQPKSGSLDLMEEGDSARERQERLKEPAAVTKFVRSNTPPAGRKVSAGTRTKQLRHQASLKTSSILAKLVSSAGKGSSYLKRSSGQSGRAKPDLSRNPSDVDDNNKATDHADQQQQQNSGSRAADDKTSSADSLQAATSVLAGPADSSSGFVQPANSIVSPLSSVSSLNSSNSSSMTVNSICVSTPMHGSCTRLHDHHHRPHWASTGCCPDRDNSHSFIGHHQHQSSSSREDVDHYESGAGANMRSRSATVPSRAYCEQSRPSACNFPAHQDCGGAPTASRYMEGPNELVGGGVSHNNSDKYKVNEILDDLGKLSVSAGADNQTAQRAGAPSKSASLEDQQTSLWLGCEDGSLIIINCLAPAEHSASACDVCMDNEDSAAPPSSSSTCRNIHPELRLGASISDIKCYQDRLVFVALADGRLAVFSRANNNQDNNQLDGGAGEWLLESPQIMTVTANELNLTSKLCLVDDNRLWYSYGRQIFVYDIETLTLKTTIMTPTNDKSVQVAMQTVTIDRMEFVPQLKGVWVSFEASPTIQFYESIEYKLLLEMSLLEPINKVLSCGNEIIRQHKTACLGTSALLSLYNESDDSSSLFIGTTAGLILVLTISREQLREQVASERSVWNPQVISLRHGHSGGVKFLQLIEPAVLANDELGNEPDAPLPSGHCDGRQDDQSRDGRRRARFILVSGGSGVDLYGPSDGQQIIQHNDGLNHLVLWEI
jgi:hypothetical protein